MAWPVLPHGFLGAQGSENDNYQIQRSLRFNSADSAYLNRTPASAGNRKTWTWSGWVKRGKLGTTQSLFARYTANTEAGLLTFIFWNDDTLRLAAGVTDHRITTAKYRDVSSWYHLVLAVDTTQATANDRIKIYVNGSQVTSFSSTSNFTQNSDTQINENVAHYIGYYAASVEFDGYLTEINFIDGQALTPSYFGETDPITGRWKAKAYTGDYGANGFYLNFSDNSGTTATTLGKDSAPISGTHTAANNWTPNNFSVTAGAGNDSLTDSPSNYGTISTTLTDDTYQIQRSLRFNSDDSAYLNRTFSTPTSQNTWTYSCWLKYSAKSTGAHNFGLSPTGANYQIWLGTDGTINWYNNTAYVFTTSASFRDPSSWYHIVLSVNSGASGSNKVRLYVNGTEITSFSTDNRSSFSGSAVNTAVAHSIGRWHDGNQNYFDGYLTEINFIDGQALTPDSFGVRDSNYLWKPKAYTGTYGTNGFYLNFSDNSGTTATTLGKDQAGSNNWTPNNFSVASGVGNDSLVDTPTYYGTDTGVGGEVRGNYCTINTLKTNSSISVSDGNLKTIKSAASNNLAEFGSIGINSGKWYFEVKFTAISGYVFIGIAKDSVPNNTYASTGNIKTYSNDGTKYEGSGGGSPSYGASYTSGDIIGVAIDCDSGTIVFFKNNTSQGTAFSSGISGNTWFPYNFCDGSNNSHTIEWNFGQRPFAYTAPSGFRALRDYNKIPVPTGGVVRGNYATLNPLAQAPSGVTLSDGNLRIATSTTNVGAYGSIGVSSGKWYFELTRLDANNTITVGFSPSGWDRLYVGNSGGGVGYHSNGAIYNNNTILQSGLPTCTTNDIIGVALNLDAGSIAFYKNNSQIGTTITGLSGEWFPAVSGQTSSTCAINFGQRPFAFGAPFGFMPLCTTLLPTPTIKKPSSYMEVVTYTGNGSSQTISSLGFSPDLVWIKSRSSSGNHVLSDTIRGVNKQLFSNLTDSEGSQTDQITAFNSNGFSLGANVAGTGSVNVNSVTYVAWAWDEAPIAGMDIVSASLSGTSPVTVNHSLGVAPKMIIGKIRSNTSNWYVNHSGLANNVNYYVMLNSTAAQASSSNIWDGAPTSTSFVVGNPQNGWNGGTVGSANYVFYLFAEVEGFSKFGSYTGNGSADGPFVFTGMRSRFLMFKRTDSTGNWFIYDTARKTFNTMNEWLLANTSDVENSSSTWEIDIISNGFKIRNNGAFSNASGGTYIFCAFAESAYKYARAR